MFTKSLTHPVITVEVTREYLICHMQLIPDTAVILNPEILAKTKVSPKTVILYQLEIVCLFSHMCHRSRRGLMLGMGWVS